MRHKFNDLPRVVRERLVKLTQPNEKDPRILLHDADWNTGWFRYFMAIAALGVIGFCINFLVERGRYGIHPRHDEEVFLGLAGATWVLLVAVGGIAIRQVWKPPPYREGKWVFPSALVQLSGGWVDVLPIQNLGRPTLVTVRRNGSYQHTRLELGHPFTFIFTQPATAEQITNTILGAKVHMMNLLAARDTAGITSVDPFAECTLSGNWVQPTLGGGELEGPTAAIVPTPVRLAQWLGSVVLAGGVAAAAFAFFSMAYQHH